MGALDDVDQDDLQEKDGERNTPDTAAIMTEELAKDGQQAPVEGEVTQPQAALPIQAPEPAAPKSITIRDTQKSSLMDPNLYIQMKAMAQDFISSKAVPQCWTSAAQVLVGLQTGLEMGMAPMESMNSLYVVNGAINVWGKATTRRLIEHGYKIEYSDETQETCTATVTKGDEKYTETMTFQDAIDSGYTTRQQPKIGWRPGMNRRKKLRYGCLSLIISTYIPQVLGSAAGIAEVSEDFILEGEVADKSGDRKAKMAAAETKHKALTGTRFTPAPVPAKE